MTPSQIQDAADWLVAARLEGRPATGCPLASSLASEAAGYAVQAAGHAVQTARDAGARVGYKIGCTNPAVQELLGVPGPAYGGVMAANLHEGRALFELARLQRPGIECEIAFRIARDPDPAEAPFDHDTIGAYVGTAAAAMEIVDNRYEDFRQAPFGLMIADDFFQSACLVGAPLEDWRTLDLAALAGTTAVDGNRAGRGSGRNVMDHPLAPLAWLANRLLEQGKGLRAGEIVLTGTMVTPIWLEPGQGEATVTVESLGEVTATFR